MLYYIPKIIIYHRTRLIMTEKQIRVLAVVATLASICMYVSYVFQIQNNLAGNKGSPMARVRFLAEPDVEALEASSFSPSSASA